jgi:hypothetical protein
MDDTGIIIIHNFIYNTELFIMSTLSSEHNINETPQGAKKVLLFIIIMIMINKIVYISHEGHGDNLNRNRL